MREQKCMEIDMNSYWSEFVMVSCNYPLSPLVYVWVSGCTRLFFQALFFFFQKLLVQMELLMLEVLSD